MKTSVTQHDIDRLMSEADIRVETVHGKCTVVSVKLKNGFVLTASSACVDPRNYDKAIGKANCLQQIESQLWLLEGYYLQKSIHESVLYECDGHACGGECYNSACSHTTDVSHAVNFHKVLSTDDRIIYVEGGTDE